MIARAVEKYIRMSPRKVRYVIEPLRQRTVAEALSLLSVTKRRAWKPVAKAIASAFANARQTDPALAQDQVVISRLFADGGPVWKRFRAAAFGRAAKIRKPTTHITVELDRRHAALPVGIQPPASKREATAKPSARKQPVKSGAKPMAGSPAAKSGKSSKKRKDA